MKRPPSAPSAALIGSGRYADVYDIGHGRVLRRYRNPAALVDRESEVMIHALAHGVPVPEVFDACGTDIVMEQARGPTMLDTLARRPWTFWSMAKLLAELHTLVHRAPALSWLDMPFGPGAALLHTDLHPGNVILTADGPRVIDWQGAAQGPPEADLAMTWVLLASGEVSGSAIQVATTRAGQAWFTRRYLGAAGPVAPRWLLTAAEHRLRDPSLLDTEAVRLRRATARIHLADHPVDHRGAP